MNFKINVTSTTVRNHEDVNKLAEQLIELKLAACVQSWQIASKYMWEGKVTDDSEVILQIKHPTHLKNLIFDKISEIHPYKVPEIITREERTSENYYNWCLDVCRKLE